MQKTSDTAAYRRDLGNGLVLRWSTAGDTERIAALHGIVHRASVKEPPNPNVYNVIGRLMSGDYPFMGPNDYGIVEDTSKEGSPVVACTCLFKHIWTYGGIPFNVGRPEMVATDPAYRNRGLIRALFEMVHARSEAEGDLVQAITGIAYFYRQFGYEYALELEDERVIPIALIPPAKEGEPEPFGLREATGDDIPMIEALYNRRRVGSIVSVEASYRQWFYEIETWKKHPELGHAYNFQVITDAAGRVVGFIALDMRRRGKKLNVWLLEFVEGVNMQRAMPSILRAICAYDHSQKVSATSSAPLKDIGFNLVTTHPVHEVLGDELDRYREPYAWYVRVQDVPAFLLHIAPALEKRLADSAVAGHTGEIKLDFYRGGLRMVFEQGRLTTVEPWCTLPYSSGASGGFPPLVFLQVLFGHRSVAELRHIFPDVWVSEEVRPVFMTLFPTRPSFVMGW